MSGYCQVDGRFSTKKCAINHSRNALVNDAKGIHEALICQIEMTPQEALQLKALADSYMNSSLTKRRLIRTIEPLLYKLLTLE